MRVMLVLLLVGCAANETAPGPDLDAELTDAPRAPDSSRRDAHPVAVADAACGVLGETCCREGYGCAKGTCVMGPLEDGTTWECAACGHVGELCCRFPGSHETDYCEDGTTATWFWEGQDGTVQRCRCEQ
jgi:hypothetical protein